MYHTFSHTERYSRRAVLALSHISARVVASLVHPWRGFGFVDTPSKRLSRRYTSHLATAGPIILEVYIIPDEASFRSVHRCTQPTASTTRISK